MNIVRVNAKKVVVTSVMLAIFFELLSLGIFDRNFSALWPAIFRTGSISFTVGTLWFLFDKHIWRWPIWRGWLINRPDLNGRWEGTVCRLTDDTPHKFVMEIKQTYSILSYKTFTENSTGSSTQAFMFTENLDAVYGIISNWEVTTKKLDGTAMETFQGSSKGDIIIDNTRKIIKDYYFTNRDPQTKGSIYVEWQNSKLLNGYE
jgi:hypothetical protein